MQLPRMARSGDVQDERYGFQLSTYIYVSNDMALGCVTTLACFECIVAAN